MYISKMITKTFEKFSYTSFGISSFMLLATAYYYTTLDIKWSIFESSLLNGVIIFGALMLSSFAIDTITRELTIERSNRNGYHLLLYPLVVLSYPIESVDLRFILSSALLWAAWRHMRIFLELTNNRKKIKRLFDASLLLSFSSLIIFENIFIFLVPIIVILIANIRRDLKYFIVLVIVPIMILPAAYVIISFLSLENYIFSSYIIGNHFAMLNEYKFNLPISYAPISIVFLLYLLSVSIKLYRATGLQRRVLDIVGIIFIILISFFFSLNQELSGSEFHYLSLPLVYFIAQIFVKKIKSLYVNFIFIILIVSILTFNFLI